MTKLSKRGNHYFINNKSNFKGTPIDFKIIKESFDFSIEMSFGQGFHRSHRSGGDFIRDELQIFLDTFQGKLSEFCLYYYFKSKNIVCDHKPDISIYGKGKWDSFDLTYKGRNICVKSSSFFSNLFLLEVKDWDTLGRYKPNIQENSINDYFVFVRIKEDVNKLCRHLKTSKEVDKVKEFLHTEFINFPFEYEITGYFTIKTLTYIIENKYILPKGSLLNGKTIMDTDNYYIQSGNMRSIEDLIMKL